MDPKLTEALPVWWRIGLLSFGGPAAQIALMHRMIVTERTWLSEREYLNALSFCMLLPGPEAMQLATYAGWRMHGTAGGLLAGLLFVLPGAAVVLVLSMLYVTFGQVPLLGAVFTGVKAAVLVVVFEALLRVAKKGLSQRVHWFIALLAFVGLFFLALPFPLIILAAGVWGFMTATNATHEPAVGLKVTVGQTLKTTAIWLTVWLAPLFAVAKLSGLPLFADLGLFFSKLAMVTFGGAYAVLAYMGQDAVQVQDWLTAPEMIDGLGLAETTPGPLILVTEFVGFLAGARTEGGQVSLGMGVFAATVTLWATFAPCFLWIFVGAPFIDWMTSKPRLKAALTAISAAVVGVILNLSIWFTIHVLFAVSADKKYGFVKVLWPDWSSLNLTVVALAVLAGVLLLRFKLGVLWTLLICAGASVGWSLAV